MSEQSCGANLVLLRKICYKYPMMAAAKTLLLITLIVLSFSRNAVWENDYTLWSDTTTNSPGKARGYNELGLYAIHERNFNLALDAFSRTLRLDPYQPVAYINVGLAYEGLKQIDMAIHAYEKAINLDPADPTAFYNLGSLYYNTGNPEKALALLLKARDLNPREADVHEYLGHIYRDRGNASAAEQEFTLYRNLK